MSYQAKPMPFDPRSISGISEKILVSHYENNYVGAVKRLNAIGTQLAERRGPDREIEVACADELVSSANLPVFDEAREEPAVVKPPDVIVFCGDAEQVGAGFAFALDAMQARDDLVMTNGKGSCNQAG